jgi:hypothetical protein
MSRGDQLSRQWCLIPFSDCPQDSMLNATAWDPFVVIQRICRALESPNAQYPICAERGAGDNHGA